MRFNPILLIVLLIFTLTGCTGASSKPDPSAQNLPRTTLPQARLQGNISLEEALVQRRSIRDYSNEALSLEDVSQLLWAAQGITSKWGGRTAPSAGALYPLEVYLVAGNIQGLTYGVYRYNPTEHELSLLKNEDVREELAEAALQQTWMQDAAADIVICAVYERTTVKYGDRGVRYVHMEAGHAAQNVYLQATALNLGTVTVGAFDDERVEGVIGMPDDEAPLYIMPVGRKTQVS